MKLKHLPNLLTLFRLCLALPVAIAIINRQPNVAISLFVLAALSDGLDGYLARRFRWQSHLGSIMDPLADKLLLLVTFIALSIIEVLPLWMTLLAVGRDLVIVVGAVMYRWLVGPYQFRPTLLGKLSTLFQLVLVVTALVRLAADIHKPFIILLPLAAVLTVASGLQYVIEWGRKWLKSKE